MSVGQGSFFVLRITRTENCFRAVVVQRNGQDESVDVHLSSSFILPPSKRIPSRRRDPCRPCPCPYHPCPCPYHPFPCHPCRCPCPPFPSARREIRHPCRPRPGHSCCAEGQSESRGRP